MNKRYHCPKLALLNKAKQRQIELKRINISFNSGSISLFKYALFVPTNTLNINQCW